MRRFTWMIAGLAFFAGIAQAQSQQGVGIDCTDGNCTTTKYGMGTKPDFRWVGASNDAREVDEFTTSADDYGPNLGGESYFYSRTEIDNAVGPDCGPERSHFPLVGQIFLTDRDDCVPTSEGPTCSGGPSDGQPCDYFDTECGEGGVCSTTGGCRVSIPLTDGGITDPADASELWVFSLAGGVLSFNGQTWFLSAATGNSFSGTSDASNPDCQAFPENIRTEPTTGTRYVLPASHPEYDGSGNQTYVRWDAHPDTRFRFHTDDSGVCCWSSDNGVSCNIVNPGTPQYPALLERSCAETGRFQMDDAITNDWVFAGGAGTAFYSDPSFTVPGETKGVCQENRLQGCVAGDGVCEALGDVCDFSEPGHRIRPLADSNGVPVPTLCGRSQYVVRGTPGEGCSLLPRYEVNGDPGMQCDRINYGINHRTDEDCNGVPDVEEDLCPWLTEWENDADRDGDCTGGDCRGDECECGDQTTDGVVNINDILGSNAAIFDPLLENFGCDANNDRLCNIQDILRQNSQIFAAVGTNTTSCLAVKPPTCGDGVVDAEFGEECDAGEANNDNGPCNTICRLVP